jgi:hypothetical protein
MYKFFFLSMIKNTKYKAEMDRPTHEIITIRLPAWLNLAYRRERGTENKQNKPSSPFVPFVRVYVCVCSPFSVPFLPFLSFPSLPSALLYHHHLHPGNGKKVWCQPVRSV